MHANFKVNSISGSLVAFRANFMKLLSEKYGDEKQPDGRPFFEDPDPEHEKALDKMMQLP